MPSTRSVTFVDGVPPRDRWSDRAGAPSVDAPPGDTPQRGSRSHPTGAPSGDGPPGVRAGDQVNTTGAAFGDPFAGPTRRAAITNLGCKVNQAEMDAVERLLRERGVSIVPGGQAADLHVVNTCTVTAIADEKSRKAVRRARRASPGARIVITGCSVQVGRAALAAADPSAILVGNEAKDGLLAEIERMLGPRLRRAGGDRRSHRVLDAALPTLTGVEIDGVADSRATIDRTRAFVKVQDGCSFHCTYCIIPQARGAERSLPPAAILADVRRALGAGHREIVLTGINIGTYDGGWSERGFRGRHTRSAMTLADLVRRILADTPIERIRLSSIEPQHIDDELLDAWAVAGAGRCLPHFHVPLQSGDDGVLRRMGRRYDAAGYARVVASIRAAVPDAAIHADVIAGFPGEDEAAFRRTVELVGELDLAGLHVFRYSARPGTAATRMVGQVDEADRRGRSAALLGIAAAARRRGAQRAAGRARRVLFEEPAGGGGWVGHAQDYVPVRVAAAAGQDLQGEIGIVLADGPDPLDPERAAGRLLDLLERPGGALRPPTRPAAPPVRFTDRLDPPPGEAGSEPASGANR